MQIRFVGLICHVEHNNAHFVVLMNEASHIPKLRIPRQFIVGEADRDQSVLCHSLAGVRVTFDAISGAVDKAGLADLPHLGVGPLHPNVIGQTASPPCASVVMIPAGTYGVEDHFALKASFNAATEPICRPRVVTFNSTETGAITLFGTGPGIPLKPNAVITITNIEPEGVTAASQFETFGDLFSPPRTFARPVTGDHCEQGTSQLTIPRCDDDPPLALGIECSNSTYP